MWITIQNLEKKILASFLTISLVIEITVSNEAGIFIPFLHSVIVLEKMTMQYTAVSACPGFRA